MSYYKRHKNKRVKLMVNMPYLDELEQYLMIYPDDWRLQIHDQLCDIIVELLQEHELTIRASLCSWLSFNSKWDFKDHDAILKASSIANPHFDMVFGRTPEDIKDYFFLVLGR